MSHQFRVGRRSAQLAAWATVAVAALATPAAHAEIVTVDFSANPLSTVGFGSSGIYLDVVTGTVATHSFVGYDINPYYSLLGTPEPVFNFFLPDTGGAVVSSGNTAAMLSPGSVVDGSATFASGVVTANQTVVLANSFFGFQFINESTSATNYGYLVMQKTATETRVIRVLGYSYENTGNAITVVPEPSTWLMMLAGVIGLGAFGVSRRRQSA